MTPVTICIHYAYPSSPMAKQFGLNNAGAFYYTIAHPSNHNVATPRGVTRSYAETAALCGPRFYSLSIDRYSHRNA